MKIVFMGTPEFASMLLERLLASGEHEVAAVVTVPDKAVGRGLKLTPSAVKTVAQRHGLPLLQPARLRDEAFLRELASFEAELFVVIAFRMLPEVVWRMPAKGTVNLHASLLPRYRGAAPIQRAIMNGEKESGVTTFLINERLDEGALLLSAKVPIAPEETGGELHDALLEAGWPLLAETLRQLEAGECRPVKQVTDGSEPPSAPKIFKEDCRIAWDRPSETIYNQIRALSPYPGAFTMVRRKGEEEPVLLKIFRARVVPNAEGLPQGTLQTDDKRFLRIAASDGCVEVGELQLFGKRRMAVRDFLAGNKGYDGACCTEG
ncbi:MAG: methionyl-tRNA formyltransferase [Bacteroidales bacterium]|nr:methionyl-tRNA formyltransferase [Bacteroidales bacterium]